MEKNFNRLEKQFQSLQQKHQKSVANLNTLKISNEKVLKENQRLKFRLEQLVQEKNTISISLQKSKKYSKQLEVKLTLGKKPQEVSYLTQLSNLKQEIIILQQKLAKKQEKINQLRKNLTNLTKAFQKECLNTQIQQQSVQFPEIHLNKQENLFEILNEPYSKQFTNQLKNRLQSASLLIEELQLIRKTNNQDLNNLQQENMKLRQENQKIKQQIVNLKTEKYNLLEYIDSLTKENSSKIALINELSKTGIKSPKAFKKYISDTQKASDTIEDLKTQLHQSVKYSEQQQVHINSLQKTIQDLKQENQYFKSNQKQTQQILESTNRDLKQLMQTLKQKQNQIQSLKSKISQFQYQNQFLNSTINTLRTEQVQSERSLKQTMEKALNDMQDIVDQRDQYHQGMEEALKKCALAILDQKSLQNQNQKFQTQIQNLINSKQLLQQTLLQQINTLKIRLESLENSVDEHKTENKHLKRLTESLKSKSFYQRWEIVIQLIQIQKSGIPQNLKEFFFDILNKDKNLKLKSFHQFYKVQFKDILQEFILQAEWLVDEFEFAYIRNLF